LVLNKHSWKLEKLDGTYSYSIDQPETGYDDPGQQNILYREKRRERLKGVRGSFEFRYEIPEFFSKLRSGDKSVRVHALILFGFSSFVMFTFLSIGIGLVRGGEQGGWYFIGVVLLTIIILVVVYTRHYRRSKNNT
jgi:hypothetical protein